MTEAERRDHQRAASHRHYARHRKAILAKNRQRRAAQRAQETDVGLSTPRQCRKCGVTKRTGDFEAIPSGRRWACRQCQSQARRARTTEAQRQQDRERGRLRREANPEFERERLRLLSHRPDQRERQRRYVEQNRERTNAKNRAWRAKNRAKHREWSRRNMRHRRLRRDPEACFYSDVLANDPCAYCGAAATGVGHIVAIARGGLNESDNLTASCWGCNRRKRETPLLLFLATRRAA